MTIKQNQSSFDFATQTSGDVKSVLDFCVLNELSLTDDLEAGSEGLIPEDTIYKNEIVVNYYESKEYELATSQPRSEGEILGIGTMIIEANFDVSQN